MCSVVILHFRENEDSDTEEEGTKGCQSITSFFTQTLVTKTVKKHRFFSERCLENVANFW